MRKRQAELVQKAAQNRPEIQLVLITRNHLLIVRLRIWTKAYHRFNLCVPKACQSKRNTEVGHRKQGKSSKCDGRWDIYSQCNSGMHSCDPQRSWEMESGVGPSVNPSFIQSTGLTECEPYAKPCTENLRCEKMTYKILTLKEFTIQREAKARARAHTHTRIGEVRAQLWSQAGYHQNPISRCHSEPTIPPLL